MENRFKMRISRMFRGSCRTRDLSDVTEKTVFVPQLMTKPTSPPKARPFSSICSTKCPETTNQAINHSIFPRKKISHRYYPPFISANISNDFFPLDPFYEEFGSRKEKKKSSSASSSVKSRNKKKTRMKTNRKDHMSLFSSSSLDSAYVGCSYRWFTSEEEEKGGYTQFSSRSLSSDSSGSLRQDHSSYRRKKYISSTTSGKRRSATTRAKCSHQVGVLPLEYGKVKDSLVVVKSSKDPYNDFRTSMVEMIVEKQIFAAKDLEHLLQCFLSLNSCHHHRIIVEVFMEIWEALFSNWS